MEHVQKYGCAFLNSDGGVLMAGILDNGRVCGIFCPDRMRREVVNSIDKEFSYFLPKVPSNFYQWKIERRRIEKLQEVNETETDVDTEKKKNTNKVTSPKRSLNKEDLRKSLTSSA
ncbi:Schlafen-like protein 1 [Acropora cervicornis]|uniref:Schlafen-like protein 1 n=1 Tax=Acropora cervicornis TaxID=6130 RepID=A0AAD9QZ02_ACRCE|nr:Schlafen-like protein 1 [Acropora cervicornis]